MGWGNGWLLVFFFLFVGVLSAAPEQERFPSPPAVC